MAGIAATYLNANQFAVSGDYTAHFIVDRAVLCDCGVDGEIKRLVESSAFGAGATTVTLKTDGTRPLTSNLTDVKWTIVKPGAVGNISLHGHEDDDDGGPLPVGAITAHASRHENAGADEISVEGLSGLLADDQHVLDAEVLAVAAALVHASRHENAGADEISVEGLSGELADAQPPKAHASDHTDGTDDIAAAGAAQKGVVTTAAQTLAGVKTFSSFPVTPSAAPTTDYQVANKKYVDDNAGAAPGGAVGDVQRNDGAGGITGGADHNFDATAKMLNLAASIWRIGEVALDLDFTGTDYDTKAECNAVGLRFSDSDTPFPDNLVSAVTGSWTHSAGNGWYGSSGDEPALVLPLMRGANWELEVVINFSSTTRYYYYLGAIAGSNHVQFYGHLSSGATKAVKLYTNDGDDTFSQKYGVTGGTDDPWTLKIRHLYGCIGVYNDKDDSWNYYDERQSAGIAYSPDYVFLQIQTATTSHYIESLKLTYLL